VTLALKTCGQQAVIQSPSIRLFVGGNCLRVNCALQSFLHGGWKDELNLWRDHLSDMATYRQLGSFAKRLAKVRRWNGIIALSFCNRPCDSKAIPGRPNTRAQRDASATGNQALRLILHQTFATPEGLILLRFYSSQNLPLMRRQHCPAFAVSRAGARHPRQ
jgi:hypothetical protein